MVVKFRHLDRLRGHTIFTSSLMSGSVVIDAGAHKGEFSLQLTEKYGCSCYLVEANPMLAAELPSSLKGTINAALSDQDGIVKFSIEENLEASQVISAPSVELVDSKKGDEIVEIESMSLETLLRRFHLSKIDLLKLDIEGAEFPLLSSVKGELLSSISQITVEFHDFKPEFQGQQLYEKCRDRLVSLGFLCCPMSFRTHGDVLFLNVKHFPLSVLNQFLIQHIARWVLKLQQIL